MSQRPSANVRKNALVIGATGFIGGHIAHAALEMGWEVHALRRNPTATGNLGNAPVNWVTGDLNDPDSLARSMRGIDTVFHAGGYYPPHKERKPVEDQIRYALMQTSNVLQAAKDAHVQQLVYTSSLTTIGKPPAGASRLANEADYYVPGSMARSAYYETKFAMEQSVLIAANEALPSIVLNPTAVFGPGDVHLTLGSLLLAIARGWGIAWLPVTINVVDVRDVARAHIVAAIQGKTGERYIIGGHNLSLRDVINRAATIAHVALPRFQVPLWLVDGLVRLDDSLPFVNLTGNHLRAVRLWQGYDTTKAEVELGLKPRPVVETLRDAFAWFNQRGLITIPS